MKIRAIRLANVGTFAAPTAVEGLGGGLDVLIGPNEMGKSTILRALKTLFTVKHTVAPTGNVVEGLRSRGGGEPVIEADFDAAGAAWRVTKRLGKGKAAALVDRGTGRIVAEGPDADEQLVRLVGHAGAAEGGIALLWADQGSALAPKPPEKEAGAALHAAIEREVEAAADGGMARKLRATVAEELERHIQVKRRNARAGSDYERALTRRDELELELQNARAAAAATAERLVAIARLRDELDRLDGAEAAAARAQARDTAAAAHEAGQRALLALKDASNRHERLDREAERAERELKALDADLQAIADLEQQIAVGKTRLADIGHGSAAAAERIAAAERALAVASAAEAKSLAALVAAERREAAEAVQRELADFEGSRAAAHALAAEIAGVRSGLQLARIDAVASREIEAAVRDLDAHAARLAAGAPRIRVDYEPGRPAGILLDGGAVAGGVELIATGLLQLVIPGVGTVTITPATNAEQVAARAAAVKLEARLGELLSGAGVADIEAARARFAERQEQERALALLEARLAALAPAGIGALDRRIDELGRRLAARDDADTGLSRPDAEAALRSAREALWDAQRACDTDREAGARALAQSIGLKDTLSRDATRLGEIAARLPPPAVRAGERQRRATALDVASAAARDAQAQLLALKETGPDDAAMAALAAAARTTAAAASRAAAEIGRLREEVAALEGAQANADEAGVAIEAGEVADELARAQAEVARFQREVAELELIAEALARAESETRERFLRPVTARIAPYLDLVFPEARLHFGEGLQPAALSRAGLEEVIGRLSSGTQEQIAILIRLGFARLFAEAGHDVPLVLDDALVYSDDERIRRMFAALTLAAASHQVLVLTCRAALFAGLGGNRLTLSPWKR